MKEPIYTWDAESAHATCTIIDNQGRVFVGEAFAHELDMDFASEKTGCTIASIRATIKYLQSVRRDVIKPELGALKQLYYSINRSKNYNPKSYESKMLWSQIRLKEEDLATINCEIAVQKQYLMEYLRDKEEFYQATRKRRAQATKDENN
jgi:hypothetical protein